MGKNKTRGSKIMKEVCNRCGQCCYLLRNELPSDIPCKYLIKLKSGKTLCRIYRNRFEKKIDGENLCMPRKILQYDYEDCPYNTDKPLVKNKKLEVENEK